MENIQILAWRYGGIFFSFQVSTEVIWTAVVFLFSDNDITATTAIHSVSYKQNFNL